MKAIEESLEKFADNVLERCHKMLCFKDDKSRSYGPPFTVETLGVFVRTVQEELQRGQAIWSKHPQDFGIYEIGLYDPENGIVFLHDQKKCLGLVQDFKTSSGVQ